MLKMKQSLKFYFTVEGETEQWYLLWLRDLINSEPTALYKVSFDCVIQKDPLKRAKSINTTGETKITHFFDYESNDDVHTTQFITTLDRMKAAERIGKQIKYHAGYSNFTFELWIVLHKSDCLQQLSNRKQYLKLINLAFDEQFENLAHYKHENEFKRVLSKLTLEDVKAAIARAKLIMQNNADKGYTLYKYKTYQYYKENPSLSLWNIIEKVLQQCGLV